jgi:hypothetical protein
MFDHNSSVNKSGILVARRDDTGAYFLDRNPKTFAIILEYLRTFRYYEHPGVDPRMVRDEADYFGLETLKTLAELRCQTAVGGDAEVITLNVGGVLFASTKETLTAVPRTKLSALARANSSAKRDESGAIFLDRDPRPFNAILYYLRTRKYYDTRDVDPRLVREEAAYYGLEALRQLAEERCPKRFVVLPYKDSPLGIGSNFFIYPNSNIKVKEIVHNHFFSLRLAVDGHDGQDVIKNVDVLKHPDVPDKSVFFICQPSCMTNLIRPSEYNRLATFWDTAHFSDAFLPSNITKKKKEK